MTVLHSFHENKLSEIFLMSLTLHNKSTFIGVCNNVDRSYINLFGSGGLYNVTMEQET